MAQSSNTVKFVYIPAGGSLPSQRDGDTIYFCVDDKKLYVGSDLIADSVDVSITGAGNYISDAVFSDGTLTLTKSTLPDVSGAMRFIGISSTEITDQGVETPTIDGELVTPESGDVVLYEGLEFVWDGSKWNQLGDESSYALKTLTITAGDGLTGGGTLASDLTLTHYTPVSATTEYGDSEPFTVIKQIKVDDFGHIVSADVEDISDEVVDAISSAVSGLASTEYVTNAISSAISGLASEEYVDDAISGLASKGYVQSAVSGLASEDYVTSAIDAYAQEHLPDGFGLHIDQGEPGTGEYLYAISPSSDIMSLTASYHAFGSIDSGNSYLVTGGIVYSAISSAIDGLASERYVDNAISNAGFASVGYVNNAISGFISRGDFDVESTDAETETYLVNLATGTSGVQFTYASVGSVGEGDGHLVTGGIVYSAISNFVSADYVSSAVSSAVSAAIGDLDLHLVGGSSFIPATSYLYNVFRDSSADLAITTIFRPFGSIASGDTDPVTGGIVYSAISNFVSTGDITSTISSEVSAAIAGLDSHYIIANIENSIGSNGSYFLYSVGIALGDDSEPIGLSVAYGTFGSIDPTDWRPVTGRTVYLTLEDYASSGYVDNAISSAIPTWTVI